MSKPIYLRNVPPPNEKFDHPKLIEFLAEWIKPEVYMEMGVRTSPVLPKVAKIAKKCIGIDLKKHDFYTDTLPDNVEYYQMSTDQYFEQYKGNIPVIDMVFIDADHSHASSLRDFDNVFPYVRNDGLIFFHDTYPMSRQWICKESCGDSYKTAWYIRQNYKDRCEILTLPFHPGLSIVRKSSKQLEWM